MQPRRERLSGVLEALGSRSAADLAVLWVGVVLVCTVLYWLACAVPGNGLTVSGQTETFGLQSLLTSLYFSMVTATSVGYGDVAPHGVSRILATCEAVAALLIFGGMVSKFVSARQDRLIEQMNRNTFEDHLGRVRTNLHLIVSDLHNMADRRSNGDIDGERLHSRQESGAALLAGEMRTIHELLQSKDQMPDEDARRHSPGSASMSTVRRRNRTQRGSWRRRRMWIGSCGREARARTAGSWRRAWRRRQGTSGPSCRGCRTRDGASTWSASGARTDPSCSSRRGLPALCRVPMQG